MSVYLLAREPVHVHSYPCEQGPRACQDISQKLHSQRRRQHSALPIPQTANSGGWLIVLVCCVLVGGQVDVTSKTEGKVDNSHMLVKYDARLRDNVAVNVVQEVTDTVQVGCFIRRGHIWGMKRGRHTKGEGIL